jgi:hypothetical protein
LLVQLMEYKGTREDICKSINLGTCSNIHNAFFVCLEDLPVEVTSYELGTLLLQAHGVFYRITAH